MSPELEFLVACCRSLMRRAEPWRLAKQLVALDATKLLIVARRHRIEGLLSKALREASIDSSEPAFDELAIAARTVSRNGLMAAAECARIRDAFEDAGLDLLFLKGLSVGHLAYGNAFVKSSWDIDVLVDAIKVGSAAQILKRLGYVCVLPLRAIDIVHWHISNKESVWFNAAGSHHVELHSRLTDNAALIPSIGMRSPRQTVTILTEVQLPTLAASELFAYLCVHGASSAWFRLKWAADLAGVLREQSPSNIERLYRSAQEFGAGRAAAQALLILNGLFDTPIPPDLKDELERTWSNRLLVGISLRQLSKDREPTARVFGTASIHFSQLLLKPGVRFMLGEARRQVKAAIPRN